MSMMVSFVLSFFPRDVLDEILNLIESVSEDFPSYSFIKLVVYSQPGHLFGVLEGTGLVSRSLGSGSLHTSPAVQNG